MFNQIIDAQISATCQSIIKEVVQHEVNTMCTSVLNDSRQCKQDSAREAQLFSFSESIALDLIYSVFQVEYEIIIKQIASELKAEMNQEKENRLYEIAKMFSINQSEVSRYINHKRRGGRCG